MASHARTYARLVEDAEPELRGPDQMRWLDLVQAELPNIRDALGSFAATTTRTPPSG